MIQLSESDNTPTTAFSRGNKLVRGLFRRWLGNSAGARRGTRSHRSRGTFVSIREGPRCSPEAAADAAFQQTATRRCVKSRDETFPLCERNDRLSIVNRKRPRGGEAVSSLEGVYG
jgi:hypothetical protein